MRLVLGADHRMLLPASYLAGAIFLVWADTVARTVLGVTEIPVGVVTAICGAPVFAYLLRRERRLVEPMSDARRRSGPSTSRSRTGARAVLRDVTLDVARGSMLALAGPNGSGKSTLLALLAGTRRPQQGHGRGARPGRSRATSGARSRVSSPSSRRTPA